MGYWVGVSLSPSASRSLVLETFGALDVNEVSVVEIAYWKMLVTSCLCLPYAFLTEGSDRMAG